MTEHSETDAPTADTPNVDASSVDEPGVPTGQEASGELASGDDAAVDEATVETNAPDAQIAELDQLIGELKAKVGTLREGEFDASALEARLRELTDLASRAASTLDSVSR